MHSLKYYRTYSAFLFLFIVQFLHIYTAIVRYLHFQIIFCIILTIVIVRFYLFLSSSNPMA